MQADLVWERIGRFDNFRTGQLLGFDGGYVAYGTTYPHGLPGAWFSEDGTRWTLTELVDPASCTHRTDASIDRVSGATNGRDVVLVGLGCDLEWFTWASSDGRDWQTSQLGVSGNEATEARVLAGTGWWDLAMFGSDVTVRRSADGIAWRPAQVTGIQSRACCPKAAVGLDGSRLMGDHLGLLVTSNDGITWRDVDVPFAPPFAGGDASTAEDWLQRIVAPAEAGPSPWVLITTRHGGAVPEVLTWTSTDLDSWHQGRLPMSTISDITWTRFGLLATGLDACSIEPCWVAPRQYLSDDGLTWTALGSSVNALHVAHGPAGVIAIGRSPEDTPDMSVWTLQPRPAAPPAVAGPVFTDAEAQLLFGLRADAQVNCVPKHEGIPSGLVAAVECVIGSALVDRVFVYAFPTDRDAAVTYLERLAEAGVSPLAGNCAAGIPGDAGSTPGDDIPTTESSGTVAFGGHVLVTQRHGCFHDESGKANVRVTCGSVYIGVMGADEDLASLSRWAMDHPGGVPMLIPSPPGICLGPS